MQGFQIFIDYNEEELSKTCSKELWLVASGEQTLPRKLTPEEIRHHIKNMQKEKGCSQLNDSQGTGG